MYGTMHIDGDVDDRDHDRRTQHANHGAGHGHGTGCWRLRMLGGRRFVGGRGIVVVMRAGGRWGLRGAHERGGRSRRLAFAQRTGRGEYSLQQLHSEKRDRGDVTAYPHEMDTS